MKTKLSCAAIALTILLAATQCRASDITYEVDLTDIGYDQSSVIGTIETDGTIGTLASIDLLSWNLEVSEPTSPSGAITFDLTNGDSALTLSGDAFTATQTKLLYDFGVIGNFEIADGGDAFGADSTSNPDNNFLYVLPLGAGSPEFTSTAVVGTATPEPSTFGIMLAGLVALMLVARRSRRSSHSPRP